jgi:hypothetical protein
MCLFRDVPDPLVQSEDGRAAGIRQQAQHRTVIRLGYDLFDEVRHLLTEGQPAEFAQVPSLDAHIRMLREWIVRSGIALTEIPPVPASYRFMVCPTHDVDFVRIRDHGFDHSVKGFLYRAVVGSVKRVVSGRLSLMQLARNWLAAAAWPLTRLGWIPDYWNHFETYSRIEDPDRSTFFLIPRKGADGSGVNLPHPERRATRYDIGDVPQEVHRLIEQGHEVGLHGIDAWQNVDKARAEKQRIEEVSHASCHGTRMHWLCFGADSMRQLEGAGFTYDSTCGYNDTIGYKAGTALVFRPPGCERILEVPLHVQDVAMFYPVYLNLKPADALRQCRIFMDHAAQQGGVLTLLWHMRSPGPERLWGAPYRALLQMTRAEGAWIAPAHHVAAWFAKRRNAAFDAAQHAWRTAPETVADTPGLIVRTYAAGDWDDRPLEYKDRNLSGAGS